MLISGIQKFTTLDYPGRISCIVFTPGCNFRCGYCHNPEFVLPEKIMEIKNSFIPEDIFFNFLKKRKGLLNGVVISGGEPTLMPDLKEFIQKIKAEGFLVKLDTNGNRPEVIKDLVDSGLLDYIAMDVKTSLAEYKNLVGNLAQEENIKNSAEFIKKCGVDYEFRATLIKEKHNVEILKEMTTLINGAKRFFLQKFRPGQTLKEEFGAYNPFSDEEIEEIKLLFSPFVEKVEVRE